MFPKFQVLGANSVFVCSFKTVILCFLYYTLQENCQNLDLISEAKVELY